MTAPMVSSTSATGTPVPGAPPRHASRPQPHDGLGPLGPLRYFLVLPLDGAARLGNHAVARSLDRLAITAGRVSRRRRARQPAGRRRGQPSPLVVRRAYRQRRALPKSRDNDPRGGRAEPPRAAEGMVKPAGVCTFYWGARSYLHHGWDG